MRASLLAASSILLAAQVGRGAAIRGGNNIRRRRTSNARHKFGRPLIVGGREAELGEFPFMVLGGGCGASLVWDDVVLTAAHCKGAFAGKVLVGAYRQGDATQGAEYVYIKSSMVQHPDYNSASEQWDFMMFKIEKPKGSLPQRIPLNENGDDPSNDQVLTTIGFGATSQGGSGSKTLLKVDVEYVPTAECYDLIGRGVDGESMLCAGVDEGGKDSCQGDSGGPIFDKSGVQVGVVSWGYGCAVRGSPGVYSRISGAIGWIRETICDLTDFKEGCEDGGPIPAPVSAPPTATSAPSLSPVKPQCQPESECSGIGTDYRGCQTTTVGGRSCQRWDESSPHDPNYTPSTHPGKGLEDGPYCRNPDEDDEGPWCYTTDPEVRWELCAVPGCSANAPVASIAQEPSLSPTNKDTAEVPSTGSPPPTAPSSECQLESECTGIGTSYQGCQSTTIGGRMCQRWDETSPHDPNYTPSTHPGKGLEDGPYCRNPDEDPGGPWCYTTDPEVRWELCAVPGCIADTPVAPIAEEPSLAPTSTDSVEPPSPSTDTEQSPSLSPVALLPVDPPSEGVEGGSPSSCDEPAICNEPNGLDYRGCVARTESGLECQRWTAQEPHAHSRTPENYPNGGLGEHSYCRNPDNDSRGPWCYTTDSDVRWEYCSIPECDCGSSSADEDEGGGSSVDNGDGDSADSTDEPTAMDSTIDDETPIELLSAESGGMAVAGGYSAEMAPATSSSSSSQQQYHLSKYLGCFVDSEKDRILPVLVPSTAAFGFTMHNCADACLQLGHSIIGLQYHGSSCYCGDESPRPGAQTAESECNTPCMTDEQQTCGGHLRNAVYELY